MAEYLIFTAVVVGLAAISYFAPRRRRKADNLMALANAVRPHCTHIGRASELNHLWHECDLHPAHDAGPAPLHHCACGAYWRRAPHETSQIQALDALHADASEPDRRH